MSIKTLTLVFSASKARGNARLLLLAIADAADHRGNSDVSDSYLCRACRFIQEELERALIQARATGELVEGQGARFKVLSGLSVIKAAPVDEETMEAIKTEGPGKIVKTGPRKRSTYFLPSGYPDSVVGLILHKCGIQPDPMQPAHWFQREHETDAETILANVGLTADDVAADRVDFSPPHDRNPRRLTQIEVRRKK